MFTSWCVPQLQRPPEATARQARPGKRANAFFTPQEASCLAETNRGHRAEPPSYSSHWWSLQHAAPCQRWPSDRFDLSCLKRWRGLKGRRKCVSVMTLFCFGGFLVFFLSHNGCANTDLSCKPGGHLWISGSLGQLLTHTMSSLIFTFTQSPEIFQKKSRKTK